MGDLGMKRAIIDTCVLIQRNDDELEGLLQIDDSLMLVSEKFMDLEGETVKQFKTKERATIAETPVQFNGIHIRRDKKNTLLMNQREKLRNWIYLIRKRDLQAEARCVGILELVSGQIRVHL